MKPSAPRTPRALLPAALLAAVAGCADPVLDQQIDALPGEVPGIRPGPTHRAGQPCTDCHSSYGQRTPTFSLAGTIFQKPTNLVGVEGVVIHVVDATGTARDLTSNCVGNFYVTTDQWEPAFPLFVTVADAATSTSTPMISKIGRDTACASCHSDPAGAGSPGHVYLTKDPATPDAVPPPRTCGR